MRKKYVREVVGRGGAYYYYYYCYYRIMKRRSETRQISFALGSARKGALMGRPPTSTNPPSLLCDSA